MKNKYPQTVCLDCLKHARKDTIDNVPMGPISECYSVYVEKCDICGVIKECTEPSDFGYPNFNKQLQRLRLQKIKKILTNI